MTWLDKTPRKQQIPSVIQSVARTDKGIILNTANYSAFLWSSSPEARHLLEALAAWSAQGFGFTLEVVPDSKARKGFSVRKLEEPSAWNPTENGYTTEEAASEANPFL